MRVAILEKPHSLKMIEERNIDKIHKDEILIKVHAAGICGSDVHMYKGESGFATYPRILGHEFAGEVAEIGKDVKNINAGDHVVVDPVVSCGNCYACSIGRHNVCSSVQVIGVHMDGGYRDYISVNQKNVFQIPDYIPWEEAATAEPYSIAAEAIDRGNVKDSDRVLICGAGPIGLAILQALSTYNVKIAVLDVVDSRLQRALKMGADLIINSKGGDMEKEILDFTSGEGASLIFEATGNIDVFEACVSKLASQAGRIVVLGFPSEYARISPFDIMRRELDIKGSRLNNNKFLEVIKWFREGRVQPSMLISHVFDFQNIEEAFNMVINCPEDVCKVILRM